MLKKVIFYTLTTLNYIFFILFIVEGVRAFFDKQMPWGWEGGGWSYENKFNYFYLTCLYSLICLTPTIYSYWLFKKDSKFSFIIAIIPLLFILGLFIHTKYFLNI